MIKSKVSRGSESSTGALSFPSAPSLSCNKARSCPVSPLLSLPDQTPASPPTPPISRCLRCRTSLLPGLPNMSPDFPPRSVSAFCSQSVFSPFSRTSLLSNNSSRPLHASPPSLLLHFVGRSARVVHLSGAHPQIRTNGRPAPCSHLQLFDAVPLLPERHAQNSALVCKP